MNTLIKHHGTEGGSERARASWMGTRRWPGRARVALAVVAALALLLGGTPQRASAHTGAVGCGIQVQVIDLLATGGFGDTPDFYTKFRNNGAEFTTGPIGDAAHITPGWKFEVGLPCGDLIGKSVPVWIEPRDSDDISDTIADVNPGAHKALSLLVDFNSTSTTGVAGRLLDGFTGAQLGVFRTTVTAGGRNVRWDSMPATGTFGAPLVSAGAGAESARLTYKIIVLSEPDFTITRVAADPTGTRTRVTISTLGGPGLLTNVTCWNRVAAVSRSLSGTLLPGTLTSVDVSLSPGSSVQCEVSGTNLFGDPEPHTDNNRRTIG